MTVRNLSFLVFVTCLANITQAEIVTTWTFNELAEGIPIIAPAPTSGVGNALLIGGTTGVGGQGTPSGAIPAGTSWVLSNFPQQGTATKTAGTVWVVYGCVRILSRSTLEPPFVGLRRRQDSQSVKLAATKL